MSARDCGTCKHREVPRRLDPCRLCIERELWEPATTATDGLTDAELVALAALVQADCVGAGSSEGELPETWPNAVALRAELVRRGVLGGEAS